MIFIIHKERMGQMRGTICLTSKAHYDTMYFRGRYMFTITISALCMEGEEERGQRDRTTHREIWFN